jgi:hypothetical protein
MDETAKGTLDALTSKRADAWMSQYAISKTEIGAQIGFYKGHVRNFQLVLGAVVVRTASSMTRVRLPHQAAQGDE